MTAKTTTQVDLQKCSQSQLAPLIGRRPSWLRENADWLPRNGDRSYDVGAVIRAMAGRIEPAELSPDDIERALQGLELLSKTASDESTAEALIEFCDSVERRYGAPGLLAVLRLWLGEWRSFIEIMSPIPRDESEADIRARYARQCDEAIENARYASQHEFLLMEVAKCEHCGLFRWGNNWTKVNPRPELDVKFTVCRSCFGK